MDAKQHFSPWHLTAGGKSEIRWPHREPLALDRTIVDCPGRDILCDLGIRQRRIGRDAMSVLEKHKNGQLEIISNTGAVHYRRSGRITTHYSQAELTNLIEASASWFVASRRCHLSLLSLGQREFLRTCTYTALTAKLSRPTLNVTR
jgi:hypothetical protein